jgi:hypothetical protein
MAGLMEEGSQKKPSFSYQNEFRRIEFRPGDESADGEWHPHARRMDLLSACLGFAVHRKAPSRL